MLLSSPQENTWRTDGRGNLRIVHVKFLSAEAPSPVVFQSGGYYLTEQMLQTDLQYAQILAGADFSPSDAAALRAADIAQCPKEPAQQSKFIKDEAELLQQQAPLLADGKRSLAGMASLRDNVWQWLGQNQQAFRDFQNDQTVGKMVLKYNPVVVHSGGTIITKAHVDSLFFPTLWLRRSPESRRLRRQRKISIYELFRRSLAP